MLAPTANALTITAFEKIEDTQSGPTRIFERTRHNGFIGVLETDSNQIILQNNINANFGVNNDQTVTYDHVMSWLGQNTFLDATLTIWYSGANAGPSNTPNDPVTVELTELLGNLTPNTSSTTFNIDGADITAWLANDILNVRINKNPRTPATENIYIQASQLSVRFDVPDQAVPDAGMTLPLFGIGALAISLARRKSA